MKTIKTAAILLVLIFVLAVGILFAASAKISGKIIVLTHRTDWVDTKFQAYYKAFKAKYPDVTVEFEAITDYDGVVRTRMGTKEYGDVLSMVTVPPTPQDFAKFYEPIGKVSDLAKKYDFISTSTTIAYGGILYGYPLNANVSGGFLYNKKVFADAGITSIAKTPEEFYKNLELIKTKTTAVPIYLNYPSKWTLVQWEGGRFSVTGDPQELNNMIHDDAPFSPGKAHYELYRILFEVVKRGLCERDLLTSDWELSKQMLADGKIGCMALGSWSIGQVRALAKNPDDIGYMPYPFNVKGKMYAEIGLDYNLAVNKNSKNKAAAMAWAKFMADESGYARDADAIPALKGSAFPEVLSAFSKAGVNYLIGAGPKAGEDGLFDKLDKESEIGLWQPPQKIRIVDAAMGTSKESFDDIMKDWNTRWAKARKDNNVK